MPQLSSRLIMVSLVHIYIFYRIAGSMFILPCLYKLAPSNYLHLSSLSMYFEIRLQFSSSIFFHAADASFSAISLFRAFPCFSSWAAFRKARGSLSSFPFFFFFGIYSSSSSLPPPKKSSSSNAIAEAFQSPIRSSRSSKSSSSKAIFFAGFFVALGFTQRRN